MNQSSDTIAEALDTQWDRRLINLYFGGAPLSVLTCPLCHALLLETDQDQHVAWHLEGNH